MGKIIKNIILILAGFLLITLIFSAFSSNTKAQTISLSNIVNLVDQQKVDTLNGNRYHGNGQG